MADSPFPKNVIEERPGRWFYDLGIRKPFQNMQDIVTDPRWSRLIGKWAWTDDLDSYRTPVFFKHIYREERIIQIVYSGQDILGDGVYILFRTYVHVSGLNVYVDPDEYDLVKGSFECKDYLKYLVTHKYISKDEARIFRNAEYKESFKNSIKHMHTICVR